MTNNVRDSGLSILLFGTQMAIGGAQKLLLDQAQWFDEHGHNVTAAFFYDKQGLQKLWQEDLTFPLITLTEIDHRSGIHRKLFGLIVGLVKLWKLLKHEHFDVIETFTYDSNLLALPLAWLARVPVRIATHHGIIENFPPWLERLHSWLTNAGAASILVSVSSKALKQAARAGIKPENMVVIPNGIPLMVQPTGEGELVRAELGMQADDILLLSVGRVVYQKGHEFLVRAMPAVLSQFPQVKVAICGDGSLRSKLDAQIRRLDLTESVRLLGNRNDIRRILESTDIFVLPSRWEGLPVALLEAMGSGLPVVATRVEGVEEVVQHGIQGLLVPPEDSAALAEALRELISKPELRKKMGRAARKRIEEDYTIDIMCNHYLELMLDLLRARRNLKDGKSAVY